MEWSDFKDNTVMKSIIPLSLNRKVYNHCILPFLTYRSETWNLEKDLERKLRSAQRGMVIIMFGISWRDRKRRSCMV